MAGGGGGGEEGKAEETEPRERYDGFTAAKRRRCLELIGEGHCIAEACARVRITTTTFYRHRKRFAGFRRELATTLECCELPLENTAWRRATVGGEERIYREGKLIQVRIKPSDAMLRLLLQARYPKKYGRLSRGGATRKQIEKRLRKEIEAEVWEKVRRRPLSEVHDSILRKLSAIARKRGLLPGGDEGESGGGGEGG